MKICVWSKSRKAGYWHCATCGVPYGGNKARTSAAQPTARRECRNRDPKRFTIKRAVPKLTRRQKRTEPCRQLGELVEYRDCETCKGKTRIKVFACALLGACTIGKPLDGLACCAGCDRYEASKRDPDPDGGRAG